MKQYRNSSKQYKFIKPLYHLFYSISLFLFFSSGAIALPSDDHFIAGYACAILEREFKATATLVGVKEGVIIIRAENIGGDTDRERLIAALSSIRGVVRVEIQEPERYNKTSATPLQLTTKMAEEETKGEPSSNGAVILPEGELFDPLIADPRWPHFSVAYQYYLEDDKLKNVAATSFGESFALLRGGFPLGGKWELGIQAAVFAIFDLDADSFDLINADYWVGLPVSWRKGRFSSLFRIFHQSSHLGDEYLLRNRVNRVNLGYESVDIKFSYDLTKPFRIYGGGGFLFDQDPSDLAPWSTQFGLELEGPHPYFGGKVRPIVAADLQNWEENNWDIDLSLRIGIQIEASGARSKRIQLMLEYFNGHSPNGQFYERIIQYMGLGTHLFF